MTCLCVYVDIIDIIYIYMYNLATKYSYGKFVKGCRFHINQRNSGIHRPKTFRPPPGPQVIGSI